MVQCVNDPTVLKFSTTQNSDKQAWLDAANSWRLPYWYWALPGAQLPKIFTTPTIQVRKPVNDNGVLPPPDTLTNPCYQYQLPKSNGSLQQFGSFGMPGDGGNDIGAVSASHMDGWIMLTDYASGINILERADMEPCHGQTSMASITSRQWINNSHSLRTLILPRPVKVIIPVILSRECS